jgi:Cu(I)/Ag(I) efflux system membrane protein CusA/SilA
VLADRVIGKPFFEISIDREAIARYGLSIDAVSRVIEVAVGGKTVTLTVEGRERYPVRVRYQRELRDRFDTLEKILVPAPGGLQVPLDQLASFDYVPGPQVIKSEDTFPVAYVVFDKRRGYSEVGVVEACRARLEKALRKGEWTLPGGVSYRFAGSYENQVRSEKKLKVVLPLALLLIFLILYLQFRSAWVTVLVFSGVFVAWAGGFILIRLYGTGWFMNFSFAGIDFRELFQIHTMNLSVAVWVGFLALFGIATDNGVILATYLNQTFRKNRPRNVKEIRAAVVEASRRRIRPCLMTTATTLLALVPILTSTGRGSDVMVPMAIPSFGGMCVVIVSVFFVPVVYGAVHETRLRFRGASKDPGRG